MSHTVSPAVLNDFVFVDAFPRGGHDQAGRTAEGRVRWRWCPYANVSYRKGKTVCLSK